MSHLSSQWQVSLFTIIYNVHGKYQTTVEPLYKFCCIDVLFHIFYYYSGPEYTLFFIPRTLLYKGLLREFPLYLQLPMCKRRMWLLTINFSAACMAAPVALCTFGFLLNNVGRESSSCNTSWKTRWKILLQTDSDPDWESSNYFPNQDLSVSVNPWVRAFDFVERY